MSKWHIVPRSNIGHFIPGRSSGLEINLATNADFIERATYWLSCVLLAEEVAIEAIPCAVLPTSNIYKKRQLHIGLKIILNFLFSW